MDCNCGSSLVYTILNPCSTCVVDYDFCQYCSRNFAISFSQPHLIARLRGNSCPGPQWEGIALSFGHHQPGPSKAINVFHSLGPIQSIKNRILRDRIQILGHI